MRGGLFDICTSKNNPMASDSPLGLADDARRRAEGALARGDDASATAWLVRARIFERIALVDGYLAARFGRFLPEVGGRGAEVGRGADFAGGSSATRAVS